MKKILAVLAILSTPALAENQEPNLTPVAQAAQIVLPCDHSFKVFELLKSLDEQLMFIGNTIITASSNNTMYNAGLYIWLNLEQQTGQLTVMLPNSNNTMCLLGAVTNFQPWSGAQPWDEEKQSY